MGKTILSPNPVKTSVRLDFNGNEIDPRTKQILVPNVIDSTGTGTIDVPYVAPPPEIVIAPTPSFIAKDDGLSVLQQIQSTKQKLVELEELKKLQIQQKKAELELLQQ